MGTLTWEALLGNIYLGTFTWEALLGNIYLGTFTWEPLLGNLYLGTFTWEPLLGNLYLGTLGESVLELLRSAPKPLLWLKTPQLLLLGKKVWKSIVVSRKRSAFMVDFPYRNIILHLSSCARTHTHIRVYKYIYMCVYTTFFCVCAYACAYSMRMYG